MLKNFFTKNDIKVKSLKIKAHKDNINCKNSSKEKILTLLQIQTVCYNHIFHKLSKIYEEHFKYKYEKLNKEIENKLNEESIELSLRKDIKCFVSIIEEFCRLLY